VVTAPREKAIVSSWPARQRCAEPYRGAALGDAGPVRERLAAEMAELRELSSGSSTARPREGASYGAAVALRIAPNPNGDTPRPAQ